MTRWVALLRGVNVNGITIKSAALAELFRSMGFGGVRTVLASGNVLFDSDDDGAAGAADDGAALKQRIEQGLRERFGYDAWIVLVRHDELAGIVEAFLFEVDADTHRYVLFGSDPAVLDELAEPLEDGPDRVARGAGVLYWACPKGSSTDTPFAKRAGRSRFRTSTTTRNITTLLRLL